MDNNETKKSDDVTLTRESYEHLVKRDEILSALEYGGVDNWDWYYVSLKDAGLIDDE